MNAETVFNDDAEELYIPEWVRNAEACIYEDLSQRKGLGNAIEECDNYPENITLKVCQLIIDNGDMTTLGRKIIYQYCFDVPGFDREWDQVDTDLRAEVVGSIVAIIERHKPKPEPITPQTEAANKVFDFKKAKTPEAAANLYLAGGTATPEMRAYAKEAFLAAVDWHVSNGGMSNVKDFSQEQLQAMAVKHPYYFSVFEAEYCAEYETASQFLDDAESWDVDYNLCFRWDLALEDDDEMPNYGHYHARLAFAKQRKGSVFGVVIHRVFDYEIPRLRAFLVTQWKRNVDNWAPLSTEMQNDIYSYSSGNVRDAVEPILQVITAGCGKLTAGSVAKAREFLVKEVEKNSPPLTSTVAIIGWFNNNYSHMAVPLDLHDVCMESLRHYQQRSEVDDPQRNNSVHDEREKFIRRVGEKIEATVEEVSICFAGEGVDLNDIVTIAHTAALGVAGRILGVIDGTGDVPVLDSHPGYFLIPKDLGIIHGPDISGHLCELLFEEINT